jgi:hypothetical protein
MDLYEQRLERLEADYEQTIAAGRRAEQRREIERAVTEYRLLTGGRQDTEPCGIETPDVDTEVLQEENREPQVEIPKKIVEPLSADEVERIKSHMSTIRLKHQPSWASNISDDQLLSMVRRLAHS